MRYKIEKETVSFYFEICNSQPYYIQTFIPGGNHVVTFDYFLQQILNYSFINNYWFVTIDCKISKKMFELLL